jgi:phosphohistidine phosphatase SixA
MAETAFLVRHGSYKSGPLEALTDAGREQSIFARNNLVARQLGGKVYLLSSDAPRALETASFIGAGLDTEVLASKRIRIAGERRNVVDNLGNFLVRSLRIDASIVADPEFSFVVVTHAPFIATFTAKSEASDVDYGGVYEVPIDRQDPKYNALVAGLFLPEDFYGE